MMDLRRILVCSLAISATLPLCTEGGPPTQGITAPKREPRSVPNLPAAPSRKGPFDPRNLNPQNPPEKPEASPAPAPGPDGAAQPCEWASIHLEQYPDSPDAIQPLPLTPIPDNPPPHEEAPFLLPYILHPSDVIHVAVLQSAPGRPLDGDRLIRPDGAISLDFFGDVTVAGLTARQAKEKIILHLRRDLTDDLLGLIKYDEKTLEPVRDTDGKFVGVPLADSDSVFVDVAQYNTTVYYVNGDVSLVGRYPWTGHDFVFDAIQYAGGLLYSADEKNIRLVRPARGTAPERVYRVDLAAIRDRGESATNYQLFPGDRIIVGRTAVYRVSGKLNHISEPLVTLANDIRAFAQTMKAVNEASLPPMTPAQRDEFIRRWTEFLHAEADRPNGPVLDEAAWKAFLERLTVPPVAAQPPPPSR